MTDQTIETLLPVVFSEIRGETIQTASARDLHAWLESGKDFSTWIKNRIRQYNFVENRDYIVLTQTGERPSQGGHNRIEYHITLDMAKQLAMVERNDRGHEARMYFLHCEKIAKQTPEQFYAIYRRKRRLGASSNYNSLMRTVEDRHAEEYPGREGTLGFANRLEIAKETEANILNRAILGVTARKYRKHIKVKANLIRDEFPGLVLAAYESAEVADAMLIDMRKDADERLAALSGMVKRNYPQVFMFREVFKKQVQLIESGGAVPATWPVHPADYDILRADSDMLEMLGAPGGVSLAETWTTMFPKLPPPYDRARNH